MATYYTLYLDQCVDFSTIISINNDQENLINLSGYSVESQFRKSPYSIHYYTFDASIQDSSNGIIALTMNSANSSNVIPGNYLYDIVVTSPSGIKTRVIEGNVVVLPGITKDI